MLMKNEMQIVRYVNGELSESQRVAFETLLESSAELRAAVAQHRRLKDLLAQTQLAEVRTGFEERFWERVKIAENLQRRPVGQSLMERLMPAGLARAAAIVSVCAILVMTAIQGRQPTLPLADPTPEVANGGRADEQATPEDAIFTNYHAESLERQSSTMEF